ncbi:MAG: hypothetical protein GXO78_12400 [Calditrichaeota bacterium]|nr:hypothetical protein [Calditrichota bacterium]
MKVRQIYQIVLLSFFIPIALVATETRVSSLGGTGYFIKDETNIFVFPATINNYPKLFVGELRSGQSTDFNSFGAHFSTANGIFAIYLNVPIFLNLPSFKSIDQVSLNHKLSFLFGTQLDNINYGLRLSIAFDRYNSGGDPEEKESARYFELAAGVSGMNADIGVMIELPGMNWELEGAKESWGGIAFGISGRYQYDFTEDLQFIPVGQFYFGPTTSKIDYGVTGVPILETSHRDLRFAVGLGTHYKIDSKNFFILGTELLGIQQNKSGDEDLENKVTVLTFPAFYAGVELSLKSWLTARLGAVQVYQKVTKTQKIGGTSNSQSTFQSGFKTTLGLGIHFGGFRIDLSINESLLFDGPNFVSGSSFPIANKISLVYEM